MLLGIDRLLSEPRLTRLLEGRRVAYLGHAASFTSGLAHGLDRLADHPQITLTAAFGPQHGMRGELQDNMQETDDYVDPVHGIPVFSLYGSVRRPTPAMLDQFDVLLFDLQDLGCRIYTYLTTLKYVLEDCGRAGKSIWVLDRPNPAGRPVEGMILAPGWESFVGCGPLPMRHGLTLGEAAGWMVGHWGIDVDLEVIEMGGYSPDQAPGYGWPLDALCWVNPSPNASGVAMARCFPGTVLLEGTTLSEGRGTTHPLEVMGAPDLDFTLVLERMRRMRPEWLAGCRLRPCHFQPTFQKHAGHCCDGLQIHVDPPAYVHRSFRPYRLTALALKAIRQLRADYPIWRDFHYEYETERLAIDLINGSDALRRWVDDDAASPEDLERRLRQDEATWDEARHDHLIYQ